MKISIIGNGTMGKQIFDFLSDKGLDVFIYGKERKLDTLKDSNLIIEAITEDFNLKKGLFKKIDSICQKKTIFATNTSSLSINKLAVRKDRFIGLHFINPVGKMKLVEVIPGNNTSDDTLKIINKFCLLIGKTQIECFDHPGFVLNRILFPMINEAIMCLGDGVATRTDIDNAMMLGANHPIGPLALADLIGLDTCIEIMKNLKIKPSNLLLEQVKKVRLGKKNKKGFYNYG